MVGPPSIPFRQALEHPSLRALIIGAGSIGQRHMRNLRVLEPKTQFVIVRRTGAPLQAWPEAILAPDIENALALKPDIAIVASPSADHFEVLPTLLAANLPTYVEKPIVTNADHVVAIREALERSPLNLHVAGFNLRYLPSLLAARNAVANGDLGQIVRASFTAGQWLPDWRKGQDHRQSYSARSADGGGVMFDLSHEFDAARFLLGEVELLSVATARVEALQIHSESVAVVTGQAVGGVLFTVGLDYVARKPIRRYELVGTAGTLTWDLPAKSLTISTDAKITDSTPNPSFFDIAATYETAMQAFLASVASGATTGLQSLSDGLRSTELSIQAHAMDQSK